MRRIGIFAIVAVAAFTACTSSAKTGPGGTKSVNAGDKSAASEVKITACTKDALGDIDIKGTAHNDTSKRSDFIIELAVTDATGATQLGTSTALAQNVESGQTAVWDGPTTVTFKAGAKCKVSTVTRSASL